MNQVAYSIAIARVLTYSHPYGKHPKAFRVQLR